VLSSTHNRSIPNTARPRGLRRLIRGMLGLGGSGCMAANYRQKQALATRARAQIQRPPCAEFETHVASLRVSRLR
jgi:hypothetical protein